MRNFVQMLFVVFLYTEMSSASQLEPVEQSPVCRQPINSSNMSDLAMLLETIKRAVQERNDGNESARSILAQSIGDPDRQGITI